MIELWPQKHPHRVDTPTIDPLTAVNGVVAALIGLAMFGLGAWHAVDALLFGADSTPYSLLGAIVIMMPGSTVSLFLVFQAVIRRSEGAAAILAFMGGAGVAGAFITIGDALLHGTDISPLFYLVFATIGGCMGEGCVAFVLWYRKIERTRADERKMRNR